MEEYICINADGWYNCFGISSGKHPQLHDVVTVTATINHPKTNQPYYQLYGYSMLYDAKLFVPLSSINIDELTEILICEPAA